MKPTWELAAPINYFTIPSVTHLRIYLQSIFFVCSLFTVRSVVLLYLASQNCGSLEQCTQARIDLN